MSQKVLKVQVYEATVHSCGAVFLSFIKQAVFAIIVTNGDRMQVSKIKCEKNDYREQSLTAQLEVGVINSLYGFLLWQFALNAE